MKTLRKVLTGVIFTVLISGCAGTQPTFNPNNKLIVFVQGKPYLIPYGVAYKKLQNLTKQTMREMGCKNGDVLWEKKEIANTVTLGVAMPNGLAGCSKPLTNKEYQYALNQQNQQAANARVNAQAYQQQQAMRRIYNQQMMQNNIYNNNQMLMWQNNQFYRNLNTINNNTAAWWRYTH